ncbi:MAG: HAMP domain-containing histidine kinase [Myxococcales bacterium]|nr:HAMP domain-containing histidine kinase [Myxococcales bacterium]
MTRKRGIALLTLVLLPLFFLGWFGVRISYEDQERARQNIRNLLRARLEDNRDQINQITQHVERQILRLFDSWDRKFTTLQQWQRDEPLVRQAFWLTSRGELRYPSPRLGQSAQEKDFLQRTRTIWEGSAILVPPSFPENGQSSKIGSINTVPGYSLGNGEPPSSSSKKQNKIKYYVSGYLKRRPQRALSSQQSSLPQTRPNAPLNKQRKDNGQSSASSLNAQAPNNPLTPQKRGDNLLSLSRVFRHGWLSWYWAEGLHLLFWKRTPEQEIVGVEVDRIVLLSRLTGKLPDNQARQIGRMMLLDGRGALVYQWGQGVQRYKEKPLLRLSLAFPLHTWSLAYNGPEAQQIQGASGRYLFDMMLLVCCVALVLLALGVYIYREWSRDMHEASQRVTFVTQVSHELKTPLTNIRLYAELLEKRVPEEDPRAQRHIRVIVDESQRLSRLIHNILTFSRQQRQKHKLHPQLCYPHELVQRIIEQFTPTFQTNGIDIEQGAPLTQTVYVDPDAVEQILGNLLNNVEKYASEGAWMSIDYKQTNETHLNIEICDKGPGIPLHLQEHIFQPFVRGSDKLSDGVTGTGIGLTIARELARQMGGDLYLQPCKEGACFCLTLPIQKPKTSEPLEKGAPA